MESFVRPSPQLSTHVRLLVSRLVEAMPKMHLKECNLDRKKGSYEKQGSTAVVLNKTTREPQGEDNMIAFHYATQMTIRNNRPYSGPKETTHVAVSYTV